MGKKLGGESYEKWLKGERLTRQKQIDAHCYQCNGGAESEEDCLGELSCPLYPYSPSAQRRGCIEGVVPIGNKQKRRGL